MANVTISRSSTELFVYEVQIDFPSVVVYGRGGIPVVLDAATYTLKGGPYTTVSAAKSAATHASRQFSRRAQYDANGYPIIDKAAITVTVFEAKILEFTEVFSQAKGPKSDQAD